MREREKGFGHLELVTSHWMVGYDGRWVPGTLQRLFRLLISEEEKSRLQDLSFADNYLKSLRTLNLELHNKREWV